MSKARRLTVFSTIVSATMLALLGIFSTATPALAFTGSDANASINAYISAYYDANAKYFYYDTNHSRYNDFWKEAISWDIVMDTYQRTGSAKYRQMINDVYDGFMARNTDMATICSTTNDVTLTNDYNDDIGWWAKGSARAYELTGNPRYKTCAKRLFDAIYAYWDTSHYGGGIWWTRNNPTQKNIATNAPAAITAARLSAILSDNSYLDKAKQIYAWAKSNLTDGAGTVYDDYESGELRTWQFTYNYGTFIGAAIAIYNRTHTASYLTDAINAANKSLTSVTTNGILKDEGTGDGGGFKGIYVRYLAELTYKYKQRQFESFLQNNANVAWSNRRSSDNLVGQNWAVTTPDGNLEAHTAGSAVTLLQLTYPDGVQTSK
jgi:predicted alpha-1,6-mannanase (GH76 family)